MFIFFSFQASVHVHSHSECSGDVAEERPRPHCHEELLLEFMYYITPCTHYSVYSLLYLGSEDRYRLQGAFLLLHLLLQFVDQVLLQCQRSLRLLQSADQVASLPPNTHISVTTTAGPLQQMTLIVAKSANSCTSSMFQCFQSRFNKELDNLQVLDGSKGVLDGSREVLGCFRGILGSCGWF